MKKMMTAFAGHLLREVRGADERKSYQTVADEVGISKPQVFGIINLGNGYGPKVEEALVDKFFDGSKDAYTQAAVDWFAARHDEAAYETEQDWRYPSLQALLRQKKHASRWSPAAVAAARSMQLDADEDPGEAWWIEQLDRLDQALKLASLPLPARTAPRGDPLADLDRPNSKKGRH